MDERGRETLEEPLAPILTAADDTAGLERAWRPRGILVAAFFGGPLAGGWLLARNAWRLGLRAHVAPITGVALLLLVAWLVAVLAAGLDPDPAVQRWVRWGLQIVTVAAAIPAVVVQQRRFDAFELRGGRAVRLWPEALAAVLAALVVMFVLASAGLLVQWALER